MLGKKIFLLILLFISLMPFAYSSKIIGFDEIRYNGNLLINATTLKIISNNTINISNNLNVTGNVQSNYFIGDGSLLTGITGSSLVLFTYANITAYMGVENVSIIKLGNTSWAITAVNNSIKDYYNHSIDLSNYISDASSYQTEAPAWKRANITDFLGGNGFNVSLIRLGNTSWAITAVNNSIKDYYNHSIDLSNYLTDINLFTYFTSNITSANASLNARVYGGEVTGLWTNLVIGNDVLDDQYYDSEADLTGLLNDNYLASSTLYSNFKYSNITEFFGVGNESIIKLGNTSWAITAVNDSIKDYYNHSIDLGSYLTQAGLFDYFEDNITSANASMKAYVDASDDNTIFDSATMDIVNKSMLDNGTILRFINLSDIKNYVNNSIKDYYNHSIDLSLYNYSIILDNYLTQAILFDFFDSNTTSANASMKVYVDTFNKSIDLSTYNNSLDLSNYYTKAEADAADDSGVATEINYKTNATSYLGGIGANDSLIRAGNMSGWVRVSDAFNKANASLLPFSNFQLSNVSNDTISKLNTSILFSWNLSDISIYINNTINISTYNRSIDLSNYISDASSYQTEASAWKIANETRFTNENFTNQLVNNLSDISKYINNTINISTYNRSIDLTGYLTTGTLYSNFKLENVSNDTISKLNTSILFLWNLSDISRYINQTINISMYNMSVSLDNYLTQTGLFNYFTSNITSLNATLPNSYSNFKLENVTNDTISKLNTSILFVWNLTDISKYINNTINISTYNRSIDLSNYISDASSYQKLADAYNNNNATYSFGNRTGDNISFVGGKLWFNLSCEKITGSADLCDGDDATGGTASVGNITYMNNTNVGDLNISGNLSLGFSESNQVICFYEDSKYCGESIWWSNIDDYFYFSDEVYISAYLETETYVKSGGDIYTTGTGDDIWLGTTTQGNSAFRAYANGNLYLLGALNTSTLNATDINIRNNLTILNNITLTKLISCDVLATDANGVPYCDADINGGGLEEAWSNAVVNTSMSDNGTILRLINLSDISKYINNTINISTYNRSIDLSNYISDASSYQTEAPAWKRANITDFLGGNGFNVSLIRLGNTSWAIKTVNDSIKDYYNHSITCVGLTGSQELCDGDDATGGGGLEEAWSNAVVNVSMLDNGTVLRFVNLSDISHYINNTINISTYNRSVSLDNYLTQTILFNFFVSNITSLNVTLPNSYSNFKVENFTAQYASTGWKLLNLTNYFGDAGINGSILRVGNISNIRLSLWDWANNGSKIIKNSSILMADNLTDIGIYINNSINITSVIASTNASLNAYGWLRNNTNINVNTLTATNLSITANTNTTIGNFSIIQYNSSCAGFRFNNTGGGLFSCK